MTHDIPHYTIVTHAILRLPLGLAVLSFGIAITQPVFTVAYPQVTAPPARQTLRCTSQWVARPISVRPIRAGSSGSVLLGPPSAALGRSGFYIVGSVLSQTPKGAGVPSALLIGPGGTPLALPAGAERGQVLRIAVADPDSVYLLWGVSNETADTTQRPRSSSPNEIWLSTRTSGKGWATPRRLFSALRIGWDDAQVPEMVRDRQGTFHLAFAAEREWANATLVHVTMRRGSAHVATMGLRGGAGYLNVVPTPNGLLVAFVAPDLTEARNANSVFVIDADGTGFHPPARLVMSSPGEEQAVALRAAATLDGGIHLVWIEQRGVGADPLLRHTESRDAGKQWSPWTDADYGGVAHMTAIPDGRDGVSVFYTKSDRSGPSHSEMMCWNGGWSQPVRLGGRLRLIDPHPVAGNATRPSLIATAMVPGSRLTISRVTWLERSPTQPCAAGTNAMACRE